MRIELLEKYLSLKEQEEQIKKQKEELAAEIKKELNLEQGKKFLNESYDAKIVTKTTFKYTNEQMIIDFLKKNYDGMFVKEVINTTAFNSVLKEGGVIADSLVTYYEKTNADTLTVSRVKGE